MKIEIKHRWNGNVLYSGEHETMKEAVLVAIAARADLARANLAGAYLAGADLTDADLAGADLTGANLTDANLAGAYLTGADLAGADLTGANLARAYLAGADLARADLARANLARAYLTDAYLAGANLAGANLAGANLTDANLAGAYLAGADLAGADLAGAYLAGAYLTDAYLAGAYLTDAYLAGADLTGANLAGADLAGAKNVPNVDQSSTPQEPYKRAVTDEERKQRAKARAARYRERHPEVPVVPLLDLKILSAVETGSGALDMSTWHSCDTTHCRAGWAITLAGELGKALEKKHGPYKAGVMIYRASTGCVPHFFASDQRAMEDIRACAAEQMTEDQR